MNRYKEYKETGFEWMGKIPRDWKLFRVGKFFNERSEKVDDTEYPPLSVTMSGIVDQLSGVAKTNDGNNRKLVKKDDFVINSRSDRKGSSGIAPRDGSVSLINIVLEPYGLDPHFIQYLFKSYYFKEEYFRNGKGIHWDLWTTRWDQLKNINIAIPLIKDQKLISRYLDKKTYYIDQLVKKIQKKIKLLKEQRTSLIKQCVTKGLDPNVEMKESGVEWIGDIPSHWNYFRNKNILSLSKNIVGDKWSNFTLLSLGKLGVTVRDIDSGKGKFPENFETYQEVKEGQFVFCLFDIDETPRTVGLSKQNGMITGAYTVFDCSDKVSPEFIYYFYLTLDDFKGLAPHYSGLRKTIRPRRFLSLGIYLPKLEEQNRIVEYIDKLTKKIDNLINLEDRKKNLLNEYRHSLISSAVTGKVKISEDMI